MWARRYEIETMNLITTADSDFSRQFDAGEVPPKDFNHRAHLRLAYIHLASHGPALAVRTFSNSLLNLLRRNDIDPAKFHETLTQSWLLAVWHFMQRAGDTASSEDFLRRSSALHDPKVMLTHYSRELLFSDDARVRFVAPDLEPIPGT
jgi:hypothetical protein